MEKKTSKLTFTLNKDSVAQRVTYYKYKSRKLYRDGDNAKYVDLSELVKDIRSGLEVTVLERETGKDITSEVLIKAIDQFIKLDKDTLHLIIKGAGP